MISTHALLQHSPALLAVLLDLLEELGQLRVRLEHGLPDLERLGPAQAQLGRQRVRRLPVQHPVDDNLGLETTNMRGEPQFAVDRK